MNESGIWTRSGNTVLSNLVLFYGMDPQLLEFKTQIAIRTSPDLRKPDKHTRKLLFYLFTSTRGGFSRLRIIALLLQQSLNTHQLSKQLDLDYKAIQHHLQVLEKNNMISKFGQKYGVTYRLSNFLEMNLGVLIEAIEKLDTKVNHKKTYI